mmetsp:Transcript_11645/g.24484  ORF Transcript_11645/g.24484 Transcript_11645/m.24484 type:complete len:125 (+) Transcript_11645:2497-2871(+)
MLLSTAVDNSLIILLSKYSDLSKKKEKEYISCVVEYSKVSCLDLFILFRHFGKTAQIRKNVFVSSVEESRSSDDSKGDITQLVKSKILISRSIDMFFLEFLKWSISSTNLFDVSKSINLLRQSV